MDGIGGTFARKSFWYMRILMKHQFLKSILVLGSVLAFMNCSDESTSAPDNNGGIQIQPSDPTLTSSATATPNSVQASSTSEVTATSSATFRTARGTTDPYQRKTSTRCLN